MKVLAKGKDDKTGRKLKVCANCEALLEVTAADTMRSKGFDTGTYRFVEVQHLICPECGVNFAPRYNAPGAPSQKPAASPAAFVAEMIEACREVRRIIGSNVCHWHTI